MLSLNTPTDVLEILRVEMTNYYLDLEYGTCQRCGKETYTIQRTVKKTVRQRVPTRIDFTIQAYVTRTIRKVESYCADCLPFQKDNFDEFV